MIKKEFKILVVKEGGLGTLLVGSSKLPAKKIVEELNLHGADGWDLAFMVIERHRFFLFWTREAAIITLSKPLDY